MIVYCSYGVLPIITFFLFTTVFTSLVAITIFVHSCIPLFLFFINFSLHPLCFIRGILLFTRHSFGLITSSYLLPSTSRFEVVSAAVFFFMCRPRLTLKLKPPQITLLIISAVTIDVVYSFALLSTSNPTIRPPTIFYRPGFYSLS